jgi:hypothetical protein
LSLSADEIARALISMMAGSQMRSNQRPDTLMQDRILKAERDLLRAEIAGLKSAIRSMRSELLRLEYLVSDKAAELRQSLGIRSLYLAKKRNGARV